MVKLHLIVFLKAKYDLEPRDGFFGGRTGALKMYEEATEEKEISYYDIISLYPKINFDTKYLPKIFYALFSII